MREAFSSFMDCQKVGRIKGRLCLIVVTYDLAPTRLRMRMPVWTLIERERGSG